MRWFRAKPEATRTGPTWQSLLVSAPARHARALAPVLAAATQFAFVMTANFVLRSVREEMGVAGGVRNLPWMFSATLAGTLVMVPVYGWAASKLGRRALATAIYGVLAVSLVGLHLAFVGLGEEDVWLSRATFVWLSVINMIAVAAFWSAVVDLFKGDDARRSFGTIAAGGTIGALAGPSLALLLAEVIRTSGLLLVGAGLWLGAIAAAWLLERTVAARDDVAAARDPVGGGMLAGLRELMVTPELRGLAIHVLAFTATSTVLYLVQAEIVEGAISDKGERTALFAKLDLAVNVLALAVQVAVTGAVLRRLSLARALVILPVVTIAVFVVLAAAPVLAVFVVVQVIRRASEHAVGKPARELLYEHVPRVTKFHGQNAVDTAVYRAGDAACAWVVEGLATMGVGTSAMLIGFAGFAGWWSRFAYRLGGRAKRGVL
jgi:AAA family ATP:ADP antiporter